MNEKYIKRAIELAKEAMKEDEVPVGAVVVYNDEIIGEGKNERNNSKLISRHAEIIAIENAQRKINQTMLENCDIYVTLEPCCHYGKTPPCTEAIIENKIARVVIGSRDPNPLVSGKGVRILREQGIAVEEDFLRKECDAINPVFFHYITSKMPYVTSKYAMTADGKIATKTGASKWITGEEARLEVQRMRHRNMAIMVGIGTVLADDPMLNVRVEGLKSPIRVICDSNLRIPMDSQIVKTAKEYRTIVACVTEDKQRISELEAAGVQVELLQAENGHVDVTALMKRLGQLGIDSVFVEGGGILNDSLYRKGLVDRMEVFVAPKVFGGAGAKSPVEGTGVETVEEAQHFKLIEVKKIGQDVCLSYERRDSKCLQE